MGQVFAKKAIVGRTGGTIHLHKTQQNDTRPFAVNHYSYGLFMRAAQFPPSKLNYTDEELDNFRYFHEQENVRTWNASFWIPLAENLAYIPIRHVYPDEAMLFLLEYFEMEISNSSEISSNLTFKVRIIKQKLTISNKTLTRRMDALEHVCNTTDTQIADYTNGMMAVKIYVDTNHDFVECDLGALATPAEPQDDEYGFLSEPGV